MSDHTPALERLRIVVGVALAEDLCRRLESSDSRIEVVRSHHLYRPMRGPADWSGDPAFQRTPESQAEFDRMIDSADALFSIPDVDPVALKRTVERNPGLRWVHTTAAGGGAQVRAAGLTPEQLSRIVFTTSAGVHGGPLAEFAVFGVLAGLKDLPRLARQKSRREWTDRWEMRQLSDMTVLILGLGGIGQVAAEKFSALGATVWGTSRTGHPVEGVERLISLDDLPEVLGEVDAVVVTLPGTNSTEGLLNADFFARLKPGAILVNVGRGTVVDEEALVAAIESGHVSFAALDVFAAEPLPKTSPLWDMEEILISPHTAALNEQEETRIVDLVAENARRLLEGETMKNVVDTVEFY